jgi:hypothetical protein
VTNQWLAVKTLEVARGRPAPGPDPGQSAGTPLLTTIAAREWVLTMPWPGERKGSCAWELLEMVRARPQPRPSAVGPRLAVVRVPDNPRRPLRGAALHFADGQAAIYCPDTQITGYGTKVLSVLSGMPRVVTGPGAPSDQVTIRPVSHDLLSRHGCHPAVAAVRAGHVDIAICSPGLISGDLAESISGLWTAHAGLLKGAGPAGVATGIRGR